MTTPRGETRPATRSEQGAPGAAPRVLEIPHALTVKELGELMGVSPVEVIKELMKNGVMAAINQTIDFDTAAIVAHDLGFEPVEAKPHGEAAAVAEAVHETRAPLRAVIEEDDPAKLRPRPPVVTVMGHVDHGKTSLLDAIRKTNVTAQEAGGITQHIGAYQVETDGHRITFLDTPGHEAFTAMRARGAQVTDIVVLVVAADDGVMPQTKEAIDHVRAAGVPMIVAINKIDLPQANPDRVKQELSENGVIIEEWGGDVPCVLVSARTGEGLKDLLDTILVLAEVQELKANPDRPAVGTVIEAQLSSTRGPLATVLVQTGTLRVGDAVIVGDTYGRIKAMFNEWGQRVKEAGPSTPVEILGIESVPSAGDRLTVVKDEKFARETVAQRIREREAAALREHRGVSLESVFGEITAGKVKELNIILKTDVQGSAEAVKQAIERLGTDEVRAKVIHAQTGMITESDVMLAVASRGVIIGFNTKVEPGARRLAEQEKVDIRLYNIIYQLTEDIDKALRGMLAPTYREVVTGHAEVRQVFKVGRKGQIAGCYVRDGAVTRSDRVRVIRGGEVVAEGRIESLRRFQEDVREVQSGYECGIKVEGVDEFQEGDVLELFHVEQTP